MARLVAVDRLEVQVLVDNATDSLSSAPPHARSEFASLAQRGLPLAGEQLAGAAHGFSCLVTATAAGKKRTVLFDAGPEGDVLARNASRLSADLAAVEAIVLSHGHWDHAGGLLTALTLVGGGERGIPVHAHRGMFCRRAMRLPNGDRLPFGAIPGPQELGAQGAALVDEPDAHTLLDGAFLVSGEVPRVSAFEKGFPGHERDDGDGWEPDPLLLDERWMAAHVKGKGLVVLSACSHAGIVNVLTNALRELPGIPIHAIVGGMHLAGGTERVIPDTVEALRAHAPKVIAAGHCTGWRATTALVNAFGDAVVDASVVGKRYAFDAE